MGSKMMTGNETVRNIFVIGLRNAHAMEHEAITLLKRQLDRLNHYPEMAARLRQHLSETEQQLSRLDNVLRELGEQSSSWKDMGGQAMGNMAALGQAMAGDEILKDLFANIAFENFEIAAYRSLITMAQTGGFNSAIEPLKQSLNEEEAVSSWLSQQLPKITEQYLQLGMGGQQAKR